MTRLVLAFLLAGLTFAARAEEPPLGRLFLTPQQRAVLDNARRNRVRAAAVEAAADKKPKPPPVKNVTIGGEFQWGRRNNFLDGFHADDFRIQFGFKYNFSKVFKFDIDKQ